MDYSIDKNNNQTISDIIGEEYKKWRDHNKIFITAPTGSGKTYFVLHKLLPYVASKKQKMVYYVNRKILLDQLQKEISMLPYDCQAAIKVETYQSLENDVKEHLYRRLSYDYPKTEQEWNQTYTMKPEAGIFHNPVVEEGLVDKYFSPAEESGSHRPANHAFKSHNNYRPSNQDILEPYGTNKYDYAICDECHYFLTDSNYNTNTAFSFSFIMQYFDSKTTVFMSATIDEVKKYIEKYCEDRNNERTEIYQFPSMTAIGVNKATEPVIKSYKLDRSYDYVDVHIIEKSNIAECIRQDKDAKWLIFVDSISYGRKLESEINEALASSSKEDQAKGSKTPKVVFLSSDYRYDEDTQDEVKNITSDGRFSAKVLIATSVIDNGISLNDNELRNLILIADTETEFIQMLGRKRQDGKHIQLYLMKQDKTHFKRRLDYVQRIREFISPYVQDLYTYVRDRVIHATDIKIYNNIEAQIATNYHAKYLQDLAGGSKNNEILHRVLFAYNGLLCLNMLSVRNLENLKEYYEEVIDSFEAEGDYAFIRRQLSWLGKSESESVEAISEFSQTATDKVIDAFEAIVGDEEKVKLSTEQNIEFRDSILNELRILIEDSEPKDESWKSKKKTALDSVNKPPKDRTLSVKDVEYLKECCGIPYEMVCERGNREKEIPTYYVIKKIYK